MVTSANSKAQAYEQLARQVTSLVAGETETVSILANVAAALHEDFAERFWWVGFYWVKDGRLVLGPFQGPVACYSIARGRGVCGTAWQRAATVVVPDVNQFPGHIACSTASRSEIVVPLVAPGGSVMGVLDVDSRELAAFDDTDRRWLELIAAIVAQQIAASRGD